LRKSKQDHEIKGTELTLNFKDGLGHVLVVLQIAISLIAFGSCIIGVSSWWLGTVICVVYGGVISFAVLVVMSLGCVLVGGSGRRMERRRGDSRAVGKGRRSGRGEE
jgi:hypothetical protein